MTLDSAITSWFKREKKKIPGYYTKRTGNKRKKQIRSTSTKVKTLCIKGYCQPSEKATRGVGEGKEFDI